MIKEYFKVTEDGATLFDGALLIGNVKLDKDVSIWPSAVLRGDVGSIEIGYGSNVQDNCTIHMNTNVKVKIGKYVSLGHNAVFHGISIGDNVLIGMGAIVLAGVKIASNSIIGAGSLITENTQVGEGELWFGNPAKFRRKLTEEEISAIKENAIHYINSCKEHREGKFKCMK